MAHYKNRYLTSSVKKLLTFSPIVGLFGHRQVGKTSLVERLAGSYVSFDRLTTQSLIQRDPETFLRSFTKFPVVLDECQLVKEVFPALKEHVRVNKRPGQFLLTGSVRFSSKKDIKESLTGRIVTLDLPPLSVSEILEQKECLFLESLLSNNRNVLKKALDKISENKKRLTAIQSSYQKIDALGGLPGVCFIRNFAFRKQKFESQIETILDRDLRLLVDTSLPFSSIRRVLELLALQIGKSLNFAQLQRQSRVSIPTLRKLLLAFEAMFLIEILQSEGGNAHPAFYFTDSGESLHLNENRIDKTTLREQTLFSQLKAVTTNSRIQEKVNYQKLRFTQFRTRGGASVPLVLNYNAMKIGIIPIMSENPDASELASARSFQKYSPNAFIIFAHTGNKIEFLNDNMLVIPDFFVCS